MREEVLLMIPLYILGLLLRFGPQHGYQIKKLLEYKQSGDKRLTNFS